jgi:hypothetical protein
MRKHFDIPRIPDSIFDIPMPSLVSIENLDSVELKPKKGPMTRIRIQRIDGHWYLVIHKPKSCRLRRKAKRKEESQN